MLFFIIFQRMTEIPKKNRLKTGYLNPPVRKLCTNLTDWIRYFSNYRRPNKRPSTRHYSCSHMRFHICIETVPRAKSAEQPDIKSVYLQLCLQPSTWSRSPLWPPSLSSPITPPLPVPSTCVEVHCWLISGSPRGLVLQGASIIQLAWTIAAGPAPQLPRRREIRQHDKLFMMEEWKDGEAWR